MSTETRQYRPRAAWLIPMICLTLAVAPPAQAAPKVVPPGNSEVDQYAETLPGASGGQQVDGNGSAAAGSTSDRTAVPAATARQLRRLGSAGRGALGLAQSTVPNSAKATGPRGDGGSNSGLRAVADAVGGSGGGGLGILLPLILGGVAAGGFGYALFRRRAHLSS